MIASYARMITVTSIDLVETICVRGRSSLQVLRAYMLVCLSMIRSPFFDSYYLLRDSSLSLCAFIARLKAFFTTFVIQLNTMTYISTYGVEHPRRKARSEPHEVSMPRYPVLIKERALGRVGRLSCHFLKSLFTWSSEIQCVQNGSHSQAAEHCRVLPSRSGTTQSPKPPPHRRSISTFRLLWPR